MMFASKTRSFSSWRTLLARRWQRALFSTTTNTAAADATISADQKADKCNAHVLSSPYNPIPAGPHPPLYEFVTSSWQSAGENWQDKVSIIDVSTGTKRTFGQQQDLAGRLATALRRRNAAADTGKNLVVALYCPNHVDYLSIALGVSLTGGVLAPINPLYSAPELAYTLAMSGASVLMVHQSKLEDALSALAMKSNDEDDEASQHSIQQVIIIPEDDDSNLVNLPKGTVALSDLCGDDVPPMTTTVSSSAAAVDTHERVCFLPHSSGTTGLPKGVCLTHHNIIANLHQIDAIEGGEGMTTWATMASSPLPFFHIYALTVNLLYLAWKGATLVTNSARFDLPTYCYTLQEYKIERAYVVPPILLGLAKHPVIDNYDLSKLQTLLSAAAPAGAELEQQTASRLGCTVKQGWGMSELSPLGIGQTDFNVRHGSVGLLAPSTRGKVVDQDGNSLGPNQDGEILIQGPQVMKEYLNDPEKTAQTLSSNSKWLCTGDVGHYDEDGYFYVTDRLKELIKVRGYPVAPAELEALLLTHPAIGDAAVIGISNAQDAALGEVPQAHVVLKDAVSDDHTQQAAEIQQWVQDKVAPYKRLDGGVVFCEQIPKSASGKILRRLLKTEPEDEAT